FKGIEKIDRIVWGRDREERFNDRLATVYRIEASVAPGKWTVIASSEDRTPYSDATPVSTVRGSAPAGMRTVLLERRSALQERLDGLRATIPAYAGTFAKPGPTNVLLRGDPMRKAEAVTPAALEAIRPRLALAADATENERRLALARWLN